jgi:ADP-ribose pyrophosphatase YjhB (NUDIX family)
VPLQEQIVPWLARAWRALPERAQWRIMWLLTPKYTVGVTGVVFDDEGRVMLLKHTFRRKYPWGLVSGWVKRGEPLDQALLREVAEETSLQVRIDRIFRVRTDKFHRMVEVVYLCAYVAGQFRPSDEVTELRWCAPDALPPGVHPHHHPLIREARASRDRAPSAAATPGPGSPALA